MSGNGKVGVLDLRPRPLNGVTESCRARGLVINGLIAIAARDIMDAEHWVCSAPCFSGQIIWDRSGPVFSRKQMPAFLRLSGMLRRK